MAIDVLIRFLILPKSSICQTVFAEAYQEKPPRGFYLSSHSLLKLRQKARSGACGYKRIISHLKTGGRCNH